MKELEAKELLRKGRTLQELFDLCEGQECMIYKAEKLEFTDDIAYIPEIKVEYDASLSEEEIEEISFYTGNDFLAKCNGKKDAAELLFAWCDWQHPNIMDIIFELDEDGHVKWS